MLGSHVGHAVALSRSVEFTASLSPTEATLFCYTAAGHVFEGGLRLPFDAPSWHCGSHHVGVGVDPASGRYFASLNGVVVAMGVLAARADDAPLTSLVVSTACGGATLRAVYGPRFVLPAALLRHGERVAVASTPSSGQPLPDGRQRLVGGGTAAAAATVATSVSVVRAAVSPRGGSGQGGVAVLYLPAAADVCGVVVAAPTASCHVVVFALDGNSASAAASAVVEDADTWSVQRVASVMPSGGAVDDTVPVGVYDRLKRGSGDGGSSGTADGTDTPPSKLVCVPVGGSVFVVTLPLHDDVAVKKQRDVVVVDGGGTPWGQEPASVQGAPVVMSVSVRPMHAGHFQCVTFLVPPQASGPPCCCFGRGGESLV